MSGTAPEPASAPVEALVVDPAAVVVAVDPVVAASPVELAPSAPVEQPAAAPAAPAAPAATAEPAIPEPVAVVDHAATPTLLQTVGKTPEPSAATEVQAEPAAPATPIYEAFAIPDGLTIEPEKLSGYTEILGKHGLPQAAGQELLDLYIAERQKDAVQTLAQQHQAFADMRKGWQKNVRTDPEIGGANYHTAMDAVATVRDRFIPPSGPIKEAFDKFLVTTGAGDHPEFLRFIARIGAAFREPAPPPAGARPPPDVGKRPAGRNGAAPLYDNPSSPQPRGM
jgi:hypothetical protein